MPAGQDCTLCLFERYGGAARSQKLDNELCAIRDRLNYLERLHEGPPNSFHQGDSEYPRLKKRINELETSAAADAHDLHMARSERDALRAELVKREGLEIENRIILTREQFKEMQRQQEVADKALADLKTEVGDFRSSCIGCRGSSSCSPVYCVACHRNINDEVNRHRDELERTKKQLSTVTAAHDELFEKLNNLGTHDRIALTPHQYRCLIDANAENELLKEQLKETTDANNKNIDKWMRAKKLGDFIAGKVTFRVGDAMHSGIQRWFDFWISQT
jgi:predicted nuclease with TOPRIM domain